MSFCQTLWQANHALYQRTLDLPFNRELAAGTLSRERFRHYMIQDAHYLVAYGRALAVAAAKADNAEGVVQFANAANEAVVEERKLHSGFMRDFGITWARPTRGRRQTMACLATTIVLKAATCMACTCTAAGMTMATATMKAAMYPWCA